MNRRASTEGWKNYQQNLMVKQKNHMKTITKFIYASSIFIIVTMGGLTGNALAQTPHYIVRDLGPGGSEESHGHGVNNLGQVTGIAGNEFVGRAFLYSNGSMQILGTLGGFSSFGYGVNYWGQVTGSAELQFNSGPHAFLYSNGTMQDLGTHSVDLTVRARPSTTGV